MIKQEDGDCLPVRKAAPGADPESESLEPETETPRYERESNEFRKPSWLALLIGAAALVTGLALVTGTVLAAEDDDGTPRPLLELPVTAMDQGAGFANNSPMLVADPTAPRFVVAANRLDAPDFGCALHLSGDGGRTWVPANVVPKLPRGADKCYGPEVAFGPKGVLYYLFVGLAGTGNEPMGAFITTSVDRGRTFSPPRRVLGPLNFAVRMAVDPAGRIHLVWLDATTDPGVGAFGPPPNPILAAHSDNGGRTFSKPVQVSDPSRQRVVAPALSLGRGRKVHVVYYDLKDDTRDYHNLPGPVWEENWEVVLATSTDGGSHFDGGSAVDSAVVPPERPILIFTMAPPAIVTIEDRTCVAWSDARHGDPDVLYRCTTGERFSPPRRLNDDRIGSGHRQYMPRLAVAPGGRIDAVYWDRRRDTRNRANDVFFTYSLDGGRTFARGVWLTATASDSQLGPQYVGPAAEGQFEMGSRLGLLSRRDSALAAWADSRNTRGPAPGHDVFATKVEDLPHLDGRPGWMTLVGGALGAAGAAALVLTRRRRGLRP